MNETGDTGNGDVGNGDVGAENIEAEDIALDLFESLPSEVQSSFLETAVHNNQGAVFIDRADAPALLRAMQESGTSILLADVTAVDYLDQDRPERFLVIYTVQNRSNGRYYRVQAWVPEEDPRIDSVFAIWKSAKWGERECHDMFGIVFEGNPDLRRFLMPEDYPGFPLLKDYPLKGHGERAQFPRVVPDGDEMHTREPEDYPVTIGRDLHTPEYIEAMRESSSPRTKSGEDA